MSDDIFWPEEAAARLRAWADEHTPRFVAHVREWADENVPIAQRQRAINDIVAAEFLRGGYVVFCPHCQQFVDADNACVEDMTMH